MPKVLKNVTVSVPVSVFREGDCFVAYCPKLDVSSYGESEDEAKRNFGEALAIFFQETARKGTLERELLRLGWTLRQQPSCKYQPPQRATAPTRRPKPASIIEKYEEKVHIPCPSPERVATYAGNC